MSEVRSAEGTIRSTEFEREARRVRQVLLRNVALLMLLLGALGVLLQQWARPADARAESRSTYSVRADGFRGVHDVSRRLGYEVRRHVSSYGDLPRPARDFVLVVLDPTPTRELMLRSKTPLDPQQLRALSHWLDDGGRAVIAMPGRSAIQVMDFEIDTSQGTLVAGPEDLVPGLLDGIAPVGTWTLMGGTVRGAGALEGSAHAVPELDDSDSLLASAYLRRGEDAERLVRFVAPTAEPLRLVSFVEDELPEAFEPVLRLDGQPVALAADRLKGRLWLLSSAYPFTNLGLARGAWGPPVVEVLDAATESGRRTLLFDEFSHGLWKRQGVLAMLASSDLRHPLFALLVLAALVGWRGSVRRGPPQPARSVPRRAKEEFVISLADLALRAERHGAAARWLHEAYRDRLPPVASSPEAKRLAERAGRPFTDTDLRRFAAALEAAAQAHASAGQETQA